MCNLLSPDEHDQQQAGANRYVDTGQLYRSQADEFRRMGNPAGAAHLDDLAADCDVVAGDILAGRRRP